MTLARAVLVALFLAILLMPAWWAAARLQRNGKGPFFRFMLAAGLALVGYLSFVNLAGRVLRHSTAAVWIWLVLNAAALLYLLLRRRAELSLRPLLATWRWWIGPVLLALVLAVPEWLAAVSTPYWDEVASSAIHVTAPNQFAEGVFPPRHNALPDIAIKYHYAFTLLSGTVRWLTGLSAIRSIDVATVLLWLFSFLFAFYWLRDLELPRVAAAWGGVSVLLGGSLDWLYLRSTEAYKGNAKVPQASELLHEFDPGKGWLANLVAVGQVPSAHLRNADGSLSNLPWDIAAQFLQHAVAAGIALTLVALYLFVEWQKERDRGLAPVLLAANVAAFSVLLLGHAVFGGVAAVTAGLCLAGSWLRRPTRLRFVRGAAFVALVSAVALLHGGLLAIGQQYGSTGDVLTVRDHFGYWVGGWSGFLHWNLAGFGLPLILAVAAWVAWIWRHDRNDVDRNQVFVVLSVFTLFSYLLPQLTYYSSEGIGREEFTEISKFFFTARFGFALLSVFAVARLLRAIPGWALLPGFAALMVTPLAFCWASAFGQDATWKGFYRAPYYADSVEQQMGEALGRLKESPRDVYFDASGDERRSGFLSEMLVFGGSVFTMTPSRYEQTGIGYRLSEDVVRQRFAQSSRIWRLLPGAAEAAGCGWYYARPGEDLALAPLLVRARFEKAVAEGYLVSRHSVGPRTLYSLDKPTADLDQGLERYWQPRIVLQTHTDADGDGTSDLLFYDYLARTIVGGAAPLELPSWARAEAVQVYAGRLSPDPRVSYRLGRLSDTYFSWGQRLADLVEQQQWRWTDRDPGSDWQPERAMWLWDWDLPILTDLEGDGVASLVAYRARRKVWVRRNNDLMPGPSAEEKDQPLPFGGRFLEGSSGDLGLWVLGTGTVILQRAAGGEPVTFRWGGRAGDVLVPGDYDGDGYDEIAVWQRTNQTWYWRRVPDGPISQVTFGTASGVPLPADYDGDGRMDLAYWEPAEGKIHVSHSGGRSLDRTIEVPPHALPIFVTLY